MLKLHTMKKEGKKNPKQPPIIFISTNLVYLDLIKAFDIVSLNILVSKLRKHGIEQMGLSTVYTTESKEQQ